VRRKERRPRRRFVVEIRERIFGTEVANVRTVDFDYSEWRTASAEELARLSPFERQDLRNGHRLTLRPLSLQDAREYRATAVRVYPLPEAKAAGDKS
jgi:hypothetical protein